MRHTSIFFKYKSIEKLRELTTVHSVEGLFCCKIFGACDQIPSKKLSKYEMSEIQWFLRIQTISEPIKKEK